ncbi:MAG: agmatinase [Hyphomicrobiales bacterium]|nr:agmatinase [Hyphomicrobiales bacterium]
MGNFGDIDSAFTRDELKGGTFEPTYSGAVSFMRRKYTRDLTGVDVAVTGIPFDTATTNRPGTRFGPRHIRAESSHIAWGPPYNWDYEPFDRLAVADYGDCHFDHGKPASIPGAIEDHIAGILNAGAATLTLGGDHYISYPILKAHAAKHGPLSLIQFDAHTDTWADEDPSRVDHGTMFFRAVRDGIVVPEKSVQIGIRTINDDPLGVNILDAPFVHQNGPQAVVGEVKRIIGDNKTYITFDIDGLDPAYAPGTGTPVIGGLTPWQAQTIIRGLAGINLVGMDVVEVAPAYDHSGITGLAAATLAYDLLALYAWDKA